MKFISFNCRGVASPSKKSSLQSLVESNQPDIILLQEMMGDEAMITPLLEATLKFGTSYVQVQEGDQEVWPSVGDPTI
jgi:exonuclease III